MTINNHLPNIILKCNCKQSVDVDIIPPIWASRVLYYSGLNNKKLNIVWFGGTLWFGGAFYIDYM